MPISFEIDHDARRLRVVATGDILLADMAAFVADIAARGCFGYSQRFDARDAVIALTADDTRRLVPMIARVRSEQGQARTAFITSSDVSFGMSRMYGTLAAETDTLFMVYRTIEEGDAWLGWQDASSKQTAG